MKTYKPMIARPIIPLTSSVVDYLHPKTSNYYIRKVLYTYRYSYFKYVKGWLGIEVIDEGVFTTKHCINIDSIATHSNNTYLYVTQL
jgi:hypothetical protein